MKTATGVCGVFVALIAISAPASGQGTPVPSPSSVSVWSSGSWGMSIGVSGSSSWSATVNSNAQSWVSVSQNGNNLAYSVSQNGGVARSGTVTLTDNGTKNTATVTFNQTAAPSSYTSDAVVNVSATAIAGGSTTVTASGTYGSGGGYLVFFIYIGYGDWGSNGCEIRYVPFWNIVYLMDDTGQFPYANSGYVGQNTTLSNSQCSFNSNSVQVSVPGDINASITIPVQVAASNSGFTAFRGTIYAHAGVSDHNNNYVSSTPPGTALTASTLSGQNPRASLPAVGTPNGSEVVFTVTYTDPTGGANLADLILSIDQGQTQNEFPNCQLFLWRPWSGVWANGLSLDIWNDQGYLTGSTSNSQCTLNGLPKTSMTPGTDSSITVQWDVTFKEPFASSPELWASADSVDWQYTGPYQGYGQVALPQEIDYIRLGSRVIAMEESVTPAGGGGQGQSVVASPRVERRRRAVKFSLRPAGSGAAPNR